MQGAKCESVHQTGEVNISRHKSQLIQRNASASFWSLFIWNVNNLQRPTVSINLMSNFGALIWFLLAEEKGLFSSSKQPGGH